MSPKDTMTVQDFLNETYNIIIGAGKIAIQTTRPRIICNDGFSISIQASELTYCKPRKTGLIEYKEVEIGYPSKKESLLVGLEEEPEEYTATVYPYIPIEIAQKIIDKHGGISELTFDPFVNKR